jgi:undecaprenyl-phosphate 4-deoxy-4-formamido-L-arabinose transferase
MMQLSIVVPVYNSSSCLAELARRVSHDVGDKFDEFELVLVNDGSPDRSWEVIRKLVDEYPFVSAVNLRRNYGQDNAIMAGLHYARGEVVAIMDDDLQHDPRDTKAMYDKVRQDYDVVYAYFQEKEQAVWKNIGSWANGLAARLVLKKPKHIYMSPFKAIARDVVNEIIKYHGPFSYVDGLIFTVTSNITQIPVKHHRRFAGKSNYSFLKSLKVWLSLATGFSVIPLRIAAFTGAMIAVCAFGLGAFFFLKALFVEQMPEGWASLVVIVLFLGGIQLMAIGAVGEYIGRIFITQNNRPQFTVKEFRQSQGASARTRAVAS